MATTRNGLSTSKKSSSPVRASRKPIVKRTPSSKKNSTVQMKKSAVKSSGNAAEIDLHNGSLATSATSSRFPPPQSTRSLRNLSHRQPQTPLMSAQPKKLVRPGKGTSVSSSVENDEGPQNGESPSESSLEIQPPVASAANPRSRRGKANVVLTAVGKSGSKKEISKKSTKAISEEDDVPTKQSSIETKSEISTAPIKQSTIEIKLETSDSSSKQSSNASKPRVSTVSKHFADSADPNFVDSVDQSNSLSNDEAVNLDSFKLNVKLRSRRAKNQPVKNTSNTFGSNGSFGSEDSEAEFDVDDNLDFDFSDKDSDFDVEKELENRPKKKRNIEVETDSSSEDQWEFVEEKQASSSDDEKYETKNNQRNEKNGKNGEKTLKILVKIPENEKKKKNCLDVEKWLSAQLRKKQREIRGNIHRVHLLACLAHGQYLNQIIGRNETLLGLALSLWEKSVLKPKDVRSLDEEKLRLLVKKIKKTFSFALDKSGEGMCSVQAVTDTFLSQKSPSYLHFTLVMLLMLRSLGVEVRLVYSMQPLTVKDTKNTKNTKNTKKTSTGKMKNPTGNLKKTSVGKRKKLVNGRKRRHSTDSEEDSTDSEGDSMGSEGKKAKRPAKKAAKTGSGRKQPRRTVKKASSGSGGSDSSEGSDGDAEMSDVEVDVNDLEKKNGTQQKTDVEKTAKATAKHVVAPPSTPYCEGAPPSMGDRKRAPLSTADHVVTPPSMGDREGAPLSTPSLNTSALSALSAVSALSALSVFSAEVKERGVDYWLEVYCAKKKVYLPIHCISGEVGQPEEIEKTATQPVHYVVAFGEAMSAKDVTSRYSVDWLTTGRKLQLDASWWAETLQFLAPPNKKRDKEEDETILEELLLRPRPTHPQLFRGHPLYILRPHLAKYEALYPSDPVPVDFVKEEPVFLRENVKLLHTRENWLREAKMIKKGEIPFKEVKKIQRKKKMKKNSWEDPSVSSAEKGKKDEMVGLFGEWQIEDFVPPVAENGIVPRNSYGNVELYKPQMIPKGCVYIPIPGINRLAKKMDIDCAAAVTGWEFSGWRAHPVLDGYVVCKEFEKKLLKAWEKEKVEIEKRKVLRKSQKAVENWRKMMKGFLIRKKLQIKYGVDPTGSGKLLQFVKKNNVKVESDSE